MRYVWLSICTVALASGFAVSASAASRPVPVPSDDGRRVSGVVRPRFSAPPPYLENFESGAPGWFFDGKWHVRNGPQTTRVSDFIRNYPLVTLPDAGFWPSAHEGTHVLVYSDDAAGTPEEGTFVAPWDPNAQAALNGGQSTAANSGNAVTPTIDLTSSAAATLKVWIWYEIESVDPAPSQFDAMLVGISTDGVNFTDIGYAGPAVDYNGNADQPATSGGFNVPGVWVQQVFDLTPYVGNVVNLRFRFQTNDNLYNAYRGWFVDEVQVTADQVANCEIYNVDPDCAAPGTIVHINGANFVNGSSVTIGGVSAAPYSVLSSNIMEATVPSLPEGFYTVVVTAPNQASCSLQNAIFVSQNCPTTAHRNSWGNLKIRYR